jgi:hypothetical protein
MWRPQNDDVKENERALTTPLRPQTQGMRQSQ